MNPAEILAHARAAGVQVGPATRRSQAQILEDVRKERRDGIELEANLKEAAIRVGASRVAAAELARSARPTPPRTFPRDVDVSQALEEYLTRYGVPCASMKAIVHAHGNAFVQGVIEIPPGHPLERYGRLLTVVHALASGEVPPAPEELVEECIAVVSDPKQTAIEHAAERKRARKREKRMAK